VVYGGPSVLFAEIGTNTHPTLAACPLWVPEYTSAAEPSAIPPQVWKAWTLWQYTESGSVDGVTGDVDRSRFNGTAEELAAWWAPAV
jgi:lysozyme